MLHLGLPEVWVRFLVALLGLGLAFAAALASTLAREDGNVTATAVFATTALLLAGVVGLTTVPYLARRVAAGHVRDAFDYEVTRPRAHLHRAHSGAGSARPEPGQQPAGVVVGGGAGSHSGFGGVIGAGVERVGAGCAHTAPCFCRATPAGAAGAAQPATRAALVFGERSAATAEKERQTLAVAGGDIWLSLQPPRGRAMVSFARPGAAAAGGGRKPRGAGGGCLFPLHTGAELADRRRGIVFPAPGTGAAGELWPAHTIPVFFSAQDTARGAGAASGGVPRHRTHR